MLKFYGYAKCDTCRRATKWLDAREIGYEFVDITQHPPTEAELKRVLRDAGVELKAMFNRSGQAYRQMKMKDRLPDLRQAEALSLLSANGRLCKRPMVLGKGKATVGFDAAVFARVWG